MRPVSSVIFEVGALRRCRISQDRGIVPRPGLLVLSVGIIQRACCTKAFVDATAKVIPLFFSSADKSGSLFVSHNTVCSQ